MNEKSMHQLQNFLKFGISSFMHKSSYVILKIIGISISPFAV